MIDAFVFWLMKFAAQLAIAVAVISLVVLIATWRWTVIWLKQRNCPHANTWEDLKCDVRCVDCGANLGFIGEYRKDKS